MTMSKDEAQITLETIEKIQQQTRRTLANGGGPIYMMIWGLVWFVGYLGSQYLLPQAAAYVWSGATHLIRAGYVICPTSFP